MSAREPEFLPDEVAWVSGASSGIGREVARRLCAAGITVFASARRAAELDTLMRETAGAVTPLPVDVGSSAGLSDAARVVQDTVGRLDVLVACAGVERMSPFAMTGLDHWQRLFDINVMGSYQMIACTFGLLREAGNRPAGQGRVVLVSSVAAVRGWPGHVAYSASKGALLAGMRSLAAEVAPIGVRVNAVLAGVTETPMQERLYARMPADRRAAMTAAHPLGLGRPSDVAEAILFLASHRARWVTGAELVVDGGLAL